MTAIAGLWDFDARRDVAESCERMLNAQKHYASHGLSQWEGCGVALGRHLSKLLPEDDYDRAPIVGGGGRYTLVADIRLDNRGELIHTLGIPVSRAQEMCDAAILMAAFERWQEQCLSHLVGDYAFAIWIASERKLILARDPVGQRPLHYHRGTHGFAFASMPKGLHALPEVPVLPDEDKIVEFLLLVPEAGTRSFYRHVERVEPAHMMTVTERGTYSARHWNPSPQRLRLKSSSEYAEGLRSELDRAVLCRLRGAENVGAHLSGGLDSSAVATTAARLLAPKGGKVFAFTAVPRATFSGPMPRNQVIDEGPYAAATTALYRNMEHVLVHTEQSSPLENLDRYFYLFERPVLNICADWWDGICDEARSRKLKVVLTGQFGNLGLSYSGLELLPELLMGGRWVHLLREAIALTRHGGMRWRGVLANTFGPWCPPSLWRWVNRIATGLDFNPAGYAAVNPARLKDFEITKRSEEENWDFSGRPQKNSLQARLSAFNSSDPGNYNKGVLGGWQLDERDPTADTRLLEFCLSVPTEQFLHRGIQRALARHALADRLPALVLNERRKGLQAADWYERLTPIRSGISSELDRLDRCAPAQRALDLPRLRRLLAAWPTDGWERREVSGLYRSALLRSLSAGHFIRRAAGSNA